MARQRPQRPAARHISTPRDRDLHAGAVAREAHARKLPVAIHAAYNVHEFFDIIREHRKTSIELLEEVGLSGARHCPQRGFRSSIPGETTSRLRDKTLGVQSF
jgi:hypothetical protein